LKTKQILLMKHTFKIIALIFIYSLIVQCVMANDTLKLARIKSYGEAWSIVAFYNPFNEDEAKDYFEMLTRELEILDNSSQTDSVFNHSLERLINFAEKRQNVIFDSNAIKPDYQLICNDLFDWIDSEYIESGKQLYFRKIAAYGVIQPDSASALIPDILLQDELRRDKEYASLLKSIEIKSKYDVLGMYIYVFNLYNYFSNYPINDCDNDSIFYSFADKILNMETSGIKQSYGSIMMQVMSSQKDSHLTTNFNNWPTPLNNYIDLAVRDSNVIVSNVATDFGINNNIKAGDKIFSVEGIPVRKRNEYYRTLLEGSNTTVTNARVSDKTLIFNTNDSVVSFSTERDGQILNHKINIYAIESSKLPYDYFPDKFTILNDSISYINLGKCNNNEFAKYLKVSKKMTTVIIDNRKYPSNISLDNKWGKYIVSSDKVFRYMLVPCDSKPGYNYPDRTNLSIIKNSRQQNRKAAKFKSNKRIFLLSSEQTISKGEFCLLYLKEATGGVVVGRNTAGVPSNVRFFRLPSNVNIMMSLLLVYDSDMNLISGSGIMPDIYIKEDIVNYEQILEIIKVNH